MEKARPFLIIAIIILINILAIVLNGQEAQRPPVVSIIRTAASLSVNDVRIYSGNQRYKTINVDQGHLITLDALNVTNVTGKWVTWSPAPFAFKEWATEGTKLIFAMPSHDVNVELRAASMDGSTPPEVFRFIFKLNKPVPTVTITQPPVTITPPVQVQPPKVSVEQPVIVSPVSSVPAVSDRQVNREVIRYRSVSRPRWIIRGTPMTKANLVNHLASGHSTGFTREQLNALSLNQLYAVHDDSHDGIIRVQGGGTKVNVLSREVHRTNSANTFKIGGGRLIKKILCPTGG